MKYQNKAVTILLFWVYLIGWSTAAQEQPLLRMTDVKWKTIFSFKNDAALSGRAEDDSLRSPSFAGNRCVISVKVENRNTKTVKQITWQLLFFADREKTELRREGREFRLNVQIKPWHSKLVEQTCSGKPASRYMEGLAMRIEYVDGSVWDAPRGGVLDVRTR